MSLAQDVRDRAAALKQRRLPYDAVCREISHHVRPLLGEFDGPQTGELQKHGFRNTHLLDTTGYRSARILKSGLLAGASNQAEEWFEMRLRKRGLRELGKLWLQDEAQSQREYLSETNAYRAMPQVYEESALFGTGVALVLDDDLARPMTLYPLTIGQYSLDQDNYGETDTLYREFGMTVRQLVTEFGQACSKRVLDLHRNRQFDEISTVIHAIEPDGHGQWRSVYIEAEGEADQVLRQSHHDLPRFVVHHWEPVPQSPYGRGLGIEALPHVIELREILLVYGKTIALDADPPTYGPAESEDLDKAPGAHNTIANPNAQIRSLREVSNDSSKLAQEIEKKKEEIRSIFYADLVFLVAGRQGQMTAREVRELATERVLVLGPVFEQLQPFLRSVLDHAFASRVKRGLVEPPPKEIVDAGYDIVFTSAFAAAMRLASAENMLRLVAFAQQVAALDPRAGITINSDGAIRAYADAIGASIRGLTPQEDVARMQQAQGNVETQRALLEDVGQLASAAQNLGPRQAAAVPA